MKARLFEADALLHRDKHVTLTATLILVVIYNDPETQIDGFNLKYLTISDSLKFPIYTIKIPTLTCTALPGKVYASEYINVGNRRTGCL